MANFRVATKQDLYNLIYGLTPNAETRTMYDVSSGYIPISLLQTFLHKNGFTFDLDHARTNYEFVKLFGKSEVSGIECCNDDNLDKTVYRVIDNFYGTRYDMFVDYGSLWLKKDWTSEITDFDMSGAWIETLYNLYGEQYANAQKQLLTCKQQALKKEIKQVENALSILEGLQNGGQRGQ